MATTWWDGRWARCGENDEPETENRKRRINKRLVLRSSLVFWFEVTDVHDDEAASAAGFQLAESTHGDPSCPGHNPVRFYRISAVGSVHRRLRPGRGHRLAGRLPGPHARVD